MEFSVAYEVAEIKELALPNDTYRDHAGGIWVRQAKSCDPRCGLEDVVWMLQKVEGNQLWASARQLHGLDTLALWNHARASLDGL